MTTEVLEGTWEDIARQAKKFVGRRVRLLVLEDDTPAEPNVEALEILKRVRDKQKNMPFTNGETGVDIVRRGRGGEMFDDDKR